MITTYKVKDNKPNDQKLTNSHPYLSEDVTMRMTSLPAYKDILIQVDNFKKSEKHVVWTATIMSVAIAAGIVHRNNAGFHVVEFIDTWFIVAAIILAGLFVVALYNQRKINLRASPTKEIALASADILKSYYIDFVEEIRPLVPDENIDLIRVSVFKVLTKAEDRKLKPKEIVLVGFCHYKESVVERSITLGFSNDYRSLTVKKFDQVAPDRTSDF